ncbi:U7 snRNA-associated Sm-like protein LSm10 [Rhipicephalus microplus]|uniref:Putative u6 snrna-associated sm-like protein lsm2 ovary overexpressed n=1 Tax=Rhipicephalus microplus TaxID=6941 RepID=A0A6M2CMZ5_RHIMP
MATPRERALVAKSLVLMLQSLRGRQTTIELRNELSVWGTVESVDAFMNVDLSDATVVGPSGEKNYASFFVQGRQVRYIHIPDDIDMAASLQLQDTRARQDQKKPVPLIVMRTRLLREKIRRQKQDRLLRSTESSKGPR